jgi:hypothetical protein
MLVMILEMLLELRHTSRQLKLELSILGYALYLPRTSYSLSTSDSEAYHYAIGIF